MSSPHNHSGDPTLDPNRLPPPTFVPDVLVSTNIPEPSEAQKATEVANLIALVEGLEAITRKGNRKKIEAANALSDANIRRNLEPAAIQRLTSEARTPFDPTTHPEYQDILQQVWAQARDMDPKTFTDMMRGRTNDQRSQHDQRIEAHGNAVATHRVAVGRAQSTAATAFTRPASAEAVFLAAAANVAQVRTGRAVDRTLDRAAENSGVGGNNAAILREFERQRTTAIQQFERHREEISYRLDRIELGQSLTLAEIEDLNTLFVEMTNSLDPHMGGLGLRDPARPERVEWLVRQQYRFAARLIANPNHDPSDPTPGPRYQDRVSDDPLYTRSILLERPYHDADTGETYIREIFIFEDGSQIVEDPDTGEFGRFTAAGVEVRLDDLPQLRSYKDYPEREIPEDEMVTAMTGAKNDFALWESNRTPLNAEIAHANLSGVEDLLERDTHRLELNINQLSGRIGRLSKLIADTNSNISDEQKYEFQAELDEIVPAYDRAVSLIYDLRAELNPLSYMRRFIEAGSPEQIDLNSRGLPGELGSLVLGANMIANPDDLPTDDIFVRWPNGDMHIKIGTLNGRHRRQYLLLDGSTVIIDAVTGFPQDIPPRGPSFRDVSSEVARLPRIAPPTP